MPVSAARFLTNNPSGFVPATSAALIGTASNEQVAAGNIGVSIGSSQVVALVFTLPGAGQVPYELQPPYQEYNTPISIPSNLSSITVYYSVAGAALTTAALGVYATAYGSSGATVTTLLVGGANGLATAVGNYAITISLSNQPSIPVPNSTVVADLGIITPSGGTAIVYGIAYI